MSIARYQHEKAAATILVWLHLAEADLVGHAVVTTNGEAGTVYDLRLDDLHGLCFTLEPERSYGDTGARRWYPVSLIKRQGPKDDHF